MVWVGYIDSRFPIDCSCFGVFACFEGFAYFEDSYLRPDTAEIGYFLDTAADKDYLPDYTDSGSHPDTADIGYPHIAGFPHTAAGSDTWYYRPSAPS